MSDLRYLLLEAFPVEDELGDKQRGQHHTDDDEDDDHRAQTLLRCCAPLGLLLVVGI